MSCDFYSLQREREGEGKEREREGGEGQEIEGKELLTDLKTWNSQTLLQLSLHL